MSEYNNYLEQWRDRARFFSHLNSNSEDDFRAAYQKEKQTYNSETLENNIRLVYLAIGLLTYGDLVGTTDLFDNLPLPPVTHEGTIFKFLGGFIQEIFPLPEYVKQSDSFAIRGHTGLLHSWFKDNKNNLVWNTDAGPFVLKNELSASHEESNTQKKLPRFRTDAQRFRQWACYAVGRTNIRESKQREFLEKRYPEVKQETDRISYEETLEDLACGILASGNLNIMDEIIEMMSTRASRRILALFSLPSHMQDEQYLINHRTELREWIHQNRTQLVWDETMGQYIPKSN